MAYRDIEKQRAFQRKWQRKVARKKKLEAVRILGNKCCKCGYNDNIAALQIDHITPLLRATEDRKKSNGINLVRDICLKKIDLNTLQLLCANCHAIKTYEQDRLLFKNYLGD